MKTTLPTKKEIDREWLLVDVADKPLGRIAVKIANVLRGKDNTTFAPHLDTGAFVIVVNAEKVKLTGRKEEQKLYKRYSGFRGGLKETPAARMREKHPDRMILQAVRGMLPKNNLSRQMFKRLKVYAGPEHPHEAQNPQPMKAS